MLTVEGEVDRPRVLQHADLSALPDQIDSVGAVIPGREGGAVWLRALLERAGLKPSAKFATLASDDSKFAICVQLAPLLEHAVLVYRKGGEPLPAAKGGPV